MKDPNERSLAGEQPRTPRSWSTSVVVAAATLALMILLSATINPLLGRYVHWNWVAVGAPIVFILLTVVLRRRWL